jgi:serine/threonine protein phosphatase 1
MLKSLFSRRRITPSSALRFSGDPVAPEQPLAVIGDLHGRIDCLNALLDKLQTEAPDTRWIFVGDYIDRGDHSAQVLDRLWVVREHLPDTVFLLGNHEEMMLSFLDDPERAGNRWIYHGGLQTMASFGFGGLRGKNPPEILIKAREHLREKLGSEREAWLRELPRAFESGNVAAVHAGADPALPIRDQQDQLTWGHEDFPRKARADGVWIVHGHTIVDMPQEKNGIISVDTGAYATNRLTAAVIKNGAVEFLQV